MSQEKHFPNGFTTWIETFYEIVSAIERERGHDSGPWSPRLIAINETQGTGGFYELAEDLTDKFEALHEGREWDGEFFDTVEEFIEEEFKQSDSPSMSEPDPTDPDHQDEEEETEYENHYECYRCAYTWTDVWTAMCDDDCPECGARHVSPHDSIEL